MPRQNKKNANIGNGKDDNFLDRRSAAVNAKAALLEAHRVAREVAEPARLARQEERSALAAARDEQNAKRKRLKIEEQERTLASKATEVEARRKTQKDLSSGIKGDEADRKAERDRRYANRKARQR